MTRVSGQITRVGKMIEEGLYCLDILNQIFTVRSALDEMGAEPLTAHLEICVVGDGESKHHCAEPFSSRELLEEARLSLKRFLK